MGTRWGDPFDNYSFDNVFDYPAQVGGFTTSNDARVSEEQLRIWLAGAADLVREVDRHHRDIAPSGLVRIRSELIEHLRQTSFTLQRVEGRLG
jgi:hypothetical protein